MKYHINEESGIKISTPDCVDEWLFDIWAIGVDYDGCDTVDSLKKLIDELVDMSVKARECLWERKLFGIYGTPEEKRLMERIKHREFDGYLEE